MATDFTYNNKTIESSGGFKPSTKDTPADVRTRVNLKADIDSIPNPYIGMHVVVLQDESNNNEMTEYVVKSLKANDLGAANSKVDKIVLAKDFLGISQGSSDSSNYVTKVTGNANQITFADGQTFQAKLDAGTLKGANAQNPNFTFAVNMIASDQTASVTTTGTYPNLIITFNIPQGTSSSGGGNTGTDSIASYDESTNTITIDSSNIAYSESNNTFTINSNNVSYNENTKTLNL